MQPTTASTNIPASTTLNFFKVDSDDFCDAEIVADFAHADGGFKHLDVDINSDSSKISDLRRSVLNVWSYVSVCRWRV